MYQATYSMALLADIYPDLGLIFIYSKSRHVSYSIAVSGV